MLAAKLDMKFTGLLVYLLGILITVMRVVGSIPREDICMMKVKQFFGKTAFWFVSQQI